MTEQSNVYWMYFRILVGVVLLALFAYLIISKSFNADLISQLLMLLIGVLEAGNGVVQFRAMKKAQGKYLLK